MNDQLSALRNLASGHSSPYKGDFENNLNITLLTSGKGGVGKSVLSALMAIHLSENARVGIVDMDLQMADQDILFQINPAYSLLDWVKDNKPVSSVLSEIKENLKLVAGVSGEFEALNYSDLILNKLKTAAQTFNTYMDHMILDWGTGMWDMLLRFAPHTTRIVVVSDTTPTSMTDTYALIKLFEVSGVKKPVFVLINRVETPIQGKIIFNKLQKVIQKFLQIKVSYAGSVIQNDILHSKLDQQISITEAFSGELRRDIFEVTRTISGKKNNQGIRRRETNEFYSVRV